MDLKLVALYLASVLANMIYDVIAPFYPIEGEKKGVSNFEVGVVFTAMPVAALVTSPMVGVSLKHIGRRTAFIVGNILLVRTRQGVSMTLMGIADLFETNWFLGIGALSRMVSGVGTAFVFTVSTLHIAYAYICSDYPDRINEIISVTEICSGLGLILGPFVGAGLYWLAGYQGMFYGLAVIFLVGSFSLYLIFQSDKDYLLLDEGENSVTSLYFRKEILLNCLPLTLTVAAVCFTDTVIAPHLETYGMNSVKIALLWGVTDLTYPLVSCYLAKYMDKFDLKRLNFAGMIITMASYWLFGPWEVLFPPFLPVIITGLTLISVSAAIHYIVALPNLIDVAVTDLGLMRDDVLIDTLSSLTSAATSFGEMMGPLLAGAMTDWIGIPDAGGAHGVGVGLFACIYFLYILKSRSAKSPLRQQLTRETSSIELR